MSWVLNSVDRNISVLDGKEYPSYFYEVEVSNKNTIKDTIRQYDCTHTYIYMYVYFNQI